MKHNKISLKVSKDDSDVAYLKLPDHPKSNKPGVVLKTIRLLEIIDGYKGPDIYLDIDKNGVLIGIEILA